MNLRLASIPLCVGAIATAQSTDFRGVRWGNTPEEVRAAEFSGLNPEMSQNTLVLHNANGFYGRDVDVVYIFSNGKLASARYQFTVRHDNDLNDFIADYRDVEPLLRKTFGDPISEKAVWLDDSLQEERKSYLEQDRATPADILPSDRNVGLAVSLGHLRLYTEWTDGRTKAIHFMTGVNGVIVHQIEYSPASTGNPAPLNGLPTGNP
jgi:hypothetical protein